MINFHQRLNKSLKCLFIILKDNIEAHHREIRIDKRLMVCQ